MKRWQLYLAAAVFILLLPKGREMDVAKLKPVELLYVYKEAGSFAVQTDTEDSGTGTTLAEALADMRDAANGEIFLETVEYVLVSEQAKKDVLELKDYIRPSTKIILASGMVDTKLAAAYLAVHKPEVSFVIWQQGGAMLPKLMTAGERYYLE